MENEPNASLRPKSSRKLYMGLSGGEMIGLLGGLGGYYTYKKGEEHGVIELSRLKQLDKQESFNIMMKNQEKKTLTGQMEGVIRDIEARLDDLMQQSSNKLQQYETTVARSMKRKH